MQVNILFIQRNHDGTVEVVDAVDEHTMDDNDQYLVDKVQEICDDLGPKKEYSAYGIVTVEVPENDILLSLGTSVRSHR